MFAGIRNFLYRHRRKFFITGGIFGGLVLLSKYAEYKLFQWHDKQTNSFIKKQKRRLLYEKTRQTANATVLNLSNSITKIVCDELPIDGLVHALHNRPDNKIQLWEELKIMGFSRCISVIYLAALAGAFVHVKLMLLSSYSFAEKEEVVTQELKISSECEEKYLSHLQNFIKQGLPSIIDKIRQATEHIIKSLLLKQQMSLLHLEGILKDIILLLSGEGSSYSACFEDERFKLTPWNRYIIESINFQDEDVSFKKITEEMLDVIDGEDFSLVVSNLVQLGLNHVIDYVAEFYPTPVQSNTAIPKLESQTKEENIDLKSPNLNANSERVDKSETAKAIPSAELNFCLLKSSLPVAKLVPILTDLVHPCLSPAPGHLLQSVLLNEQLENLSFNIYEAFSISN